MFNTSVKQKTLLVACTLALGACASSGPVAPTRGYVSDSRAAIVKSGFGLCWHTPTWSPAVAELECDPDLVKKPAPPAPAPAPAPARAPAPVVAPPAAPAPAAVAPVTEKVTLAADVLFDFDKSVVKPEGQAKLNDLVNKLKTVNLEVIIAIGHTDWIGSVAYNQRLSVRRAEAVKKYLVSKGIEPNRIYTEGKGKKQPIADNKTSAGRAKNRRVEIEVVGTRKK
jgi:OOP family OmpA-OmpF porin